MSIEDYEWPSNIAEADKIGSKYLEREGIDTRFYEEPFLEASELGDAVSLRQRLAGISSDEKRRLVRSVDQQGCTGLLLMAKAGDVEMVGVLLDADANPNDSDCSGATALHYASARPSLGVVELLLRCRADATAYDERGDTPLMWAYGGRVRSVLLEANADPLAENKYGQTAIMLASGRGDLEGIRSLAQLLSPTDLNACDKQGCSAHAAALAGGHADAAEVLVELGATASVQQSAQVICQEADALHEVARRGDADACAAMLQKGGLDVDAEIGGETALLLAAAAGSGRAVEVLLQARADPNCADAFMQETPLMRAIFSQADDSLLWLLLEARANPVQTDLTGRTAVEVATAWGRKDTAKILQAAVAGELSLSGMD